MPTIFHEMLRRRPVGLGMLSATKDGLCVSDVYLQELSAMGMESGEVAMQLLLVVNQQRQFQNNPDVQYPDFAIFLPCQTFLLPNRIL
jgi:hypothetical protein